MASFETKLFTAEHSELESVIASYSYDRNPLVRKAVIDNANVTEDILNYLLNDVDPEIRQLSAQKLAQLHPELNQIPASPEDLQDNRLKCKNCKEPTLPGENFCRNCGHEVTIKNPYCSDCDLELEADSLYCRFCGSKLLNTRS